MNILKYLLIPICLLLLIADNSYAQDFSSEIQALENDLKDFNYQIVLNKGRFLLSESNITKKDSLQIYGYILNAAYSLNDTTMAKDIIKDALKSFPSFAPDPRITSPKIVNYFNSVRMRFINSKPEEQPIVNDRKNLLIKPVPTKYLLTSILYPGSSHWFKGYKKGYYFTGISTILLGGIVYSSLKVGDTRENYMQAKTNENFDRLYNDYNSAYKIRNSLILTYMAFNIYTLYDFYSNEIKNTELSVSMIQNPNSVAIQFSYSW
jgi:hypothetical protein